MRTNLAERLGYEPEEETRERQQRLMEELRYREAIHAKVEELSERYANLAKRDRERAEKYKQLMALVESAERMQETKEETNG